MSALNEQPHFRVAQWTILFAITGDVPLDFGGHGLIRFTRRGCRGRGSARPQQGSPRSGRLLDQSIKMTAFAAISVAAALLLRTSPHFPRLAPLRQSLDLHCSAAAPVLMHCKFGLDQGASVRTGPDTGNGEDP